MKSYFDIRVENGYVAYDDDRLLFSDDLAAMSAAATEARSLGIRPALARSALAVEAIVIMDERGRFLTEITVRAARLLM